MMRMIIVRRGETIDTKGKNEKKDSKTFMLVGSSLLMMFPS